MRARLLVVLGAMGLWGCEVIGGGGGELLTDGGAPAPNVSLGLSREAIGVYSFIAPPTVSTQRFSDEVVFTNVSDPRCSVSLLAPAPASMNRAEQATLLIIARTPDAAGLRDEQGGARPADFQHLVVTADGFAGVSVEGTAVTALGTALTRARALLIDLGDGRVAPMLGLGDCFNPAGDANLDWARVFHSLRFTGAATADRTLAQLLPGKWSFESGGSFLGQTFAGNGRFAQTSDPAVFNAVQSGDVTGETSTFRGDGAWSVTEDRLTTFPAQGLPATRYFRIDEALDAAAPGGVRLQLRVLDLAFDGTPLEYTLTRATQ